MLRKFVCAVAVVGFSLGLALAEDLNGRITKIDEKKVTFQQADPDNKGKFKDAKEYDLAKDVKVSKMDKKNKVEVAGGVKAEELTKIGEKGLNATISVNDGKVTEIVLKGKKGKTN